MTDETTDPEEFVRENREKLLAIIHHSADPFTRACAWALLDRYTSDMDVETLQEELEMIANQERMS